MLPRLEEAVEGAAENIVCFARLASEDDALLCELAKPLLTRTDEGYLVAFSDKKPLFTRACLTALKGLGVEKDYTSAHLDSAFALQYLERGAKLHFPKGVQAERQENALFFYLYEEECFSEKSEMKLFTEEGFDGGRYEVSITSVLPKDEETEWKILRFDRDKLSNSAVFRFRQDGDEIRTFGGTKTLKKLFNEKKIPPKERGYIPLLAERENGSVYAVCGVEISEKIKVDESTQKVLYILLRRRDK